MWAKNLKLLSFLFFFLCKLACIRHASSVSHHSFVHGTFILHALQHRVTIIVVRTVMNQTPHPTSHACLAFEEFEKQSFSDYLLLQYVILLLMCSGIRISVFYLIWLIVFPLAEISERR